MKLLTPVIIGVALTFLGSCSFRDQAAPNPSTYRKLAPGDDNQPTHIKVFFDGTANDWSARTNVRRRFELMASAEDPQSPCLYIEGVGVNTLSGKVFGTGMKARVIKAYTFLARHWSKNRGDTIQIYGFSRGAFQARMLAGLMAHCGLPDASQKSEKELQALAASIWDFCADRLTDPPQPADGSRIPLSTWQKTLANNQQQIRSYKKHQGWTFNYPDISLLGIWDTVPGLPFAKLREDGEVIVGKKQIYKVRPYPNIKLVIHALSLDEKRSQFAPLIVGPPIDPDCKVHEVWFPGAHSDVGGGYADSNDMAGISMVWMQEVMVMEGVTKGKHTFYSDSHGILHHPEQAFENRLTSRSLRRQLPPGSYVHYSVFKRTNNEPHPEEHFTEGVLYQPTLEVAQPHKLGEEPLPPLTLKVTPRKYTDDKDQRMAAADLRKVGLKLYGFDADEDKAITGAPLSITQMAVDVQPSAAVPIKTEVKPAP